MRFNSRCFHPLEKLSVKQRHSDIYKISRTSRSDLSTYEGELSVRSSQDVFSLSFHTCGLT